MVYLIVFLILGVSFIVGGLYRVRLMVSWMSYNLRISIRILAWHRLLGYVWSGNARPDSGWILLNRVQTRKKPRKRKLKEKEPKNKGSKESRSKHKRVRTACLLKQSISHAPEWLCRFIRHVHFDRCDIEGSLAFHDPAQTGIVYGVAQACYALLDESWHVNVSPDFIGAESDGSVKIEFRFFLLPLLWEGICTGFRFGLVLWRCRV